MEGALLCHDGVGRRLTLEEAQAYRGPGFLWVHLEGRDENDRALIENHSEIPHFAANALFATETRPRCDPIDSGAILNLRGPGDCDPHIATSRKAIRKRGPRSEREQMKRM